MTISSFDRRNAECEFGGGAFNVGSHGVDRGGRRSAFKQQRQPDGAQKEQRDQRSVGDGSAP